MESLIQMNTPPVLTGAEVELRICAIVENSIENAQYFWEVQSNWQTHSPDCADWAAFCETVLIPRFKAANIKTYSRPYIDQMINWYIAKRSLPEDLAPRLKNEAQGRELAKVPVDRREEVMREALRTAPVIKSFKFPQGMKNNSAAHIKATAERLLVPVPEAPSSSAMVDSFFGSSESEPSTELAVLPPVPAADAPELSMAANTAIAATLASEEATEAKEADEEEEADNEAGYAEQSVDFPPLAELPNNPISAMRYDPHADCIWLTICKNNQRPFALHISGKRLRAIMGIGTH